MRLGVEGVVWDYKPGLETEFETAAKTAKLPGIFSYVRG